MFLLGLFQIFLALFLLQAATFFQWLFPRPCAPLRLRAAFWLFECGMGADEVAISHLQEWGSSGCRALVRLATDPHSAISSRFMAIFLLRLAFPEDFPSHAEVIIDSLPDDESRAQIQRQIDSLR